jgi:hypothetical protein
MRWVRQWVVVAGLLLGPLSVLVFLRLFSRFDVGWFSADAHLVIVSAISLFALAAALAALATAVRSQQANVIWLGIGCAVVGVGMLGHGLTTPGVFGQPDNVWVSRLPYLAMCVFAACLAAAGRSPSWWPNRIARRHPALAVGAPVAAVAVLITTATLRPLTLGGGQRYGWEESALDVVSVLTVVLLLTVIRTHWHRWHLGHDVVQFAVVLAAAAAIAAVVAFEHGRFGQISWWDYHAYLFAGFGGAVYAVFRRRNDERKLTEVLDGAFVDDPFDHIVSGYPEALRSLVRAVEIKDAYTHGHSQRTARVAVEIGLLMGLGPDRLRVLARGAYLHDVGKIGIPDDILNKPGALTAEERDVIQTHPRLGFELASSAPSLREALPVILHHHERVDGCGYPGGLTGAEIPLEARVVAVADVWDALTSDRAYRRGWAPEAALAHIRAGAGTHFDTVVVDAFTTLVAGWGIRDHAHAGTAAVAWEAAETCHEIDEARLASV